jgi:tetratricopeptide (TPR) repeat protein
MGDNEAARQSLAKLQQLGDRVAGKEGLYVRALLADLAEGNVEKAMVTLREILADFPDEKRARFDLGTFYYRLGKYEEALAELNQAVKLDPQYGFAMNMLAYTYAQLQNYDQAIEWFKKYALASPADANPHDSLGDVYYNTGKFDLALEKYEEALRIKPDFGSGYKISYIQALLGDYEKAMIWADRHIAASTSDADKAWGSVLKAIYLHMQARPSLAFRMLDEALKQAERGEALAIIDSVYRTRLWIAWEWRDYDLFIRTAKERYDFRAARKYLPEERNRFIYAYYEGLFELKRKGLAAAQERLAAVEKSRPTPQPAAEAEVWTTGVEHLRAEILLAEGRPDEARLAFEKIQRRSVSILQAFILVQRSMPYLQDIPARAQVMNGRKDLAISLYERLVSSDPWKREMEILHPFSRLELAKLYESSGERGKALDQLEHLAELWKDADQGLPQVEEAGQRLAVLRRSKN